MGQHESGGPAGTSAQLNQMEDSHTLIQDLSSGDDLRAEAAVRKLAQQGEKVLPALRELLESVNADTRWWATWALASLSHPQVRPLLRGLLKDPDTSVRQCAALALRERPDSDAIPDLVNLLEEQDPILARLAAAALIALGREAVPALLEVVQNGSQPARLEAIRSLASIGDERAIPALYTAYQEGTAMMEFWANEGLEKLGVGIVLFNPGEQSPAPDA
jgi:HEAT repeat protein